jgi:uncharacterized protein YbjT (DUF2867 family)
MRLTVFGASGGIGGQVVRQALDLGYAVTAVVRDPSAFAIRHPALDVLTVPGLTDPEPLRPALKDSDAVISGVGPRGRKDGPVASRATRGILQAMRDTGVARLVVVSAAPVGPVPPGDSWLNRVLVFRMIGALLRDTYLDLAEMEAQIRDSGTQWTVVRPPKLVDKPLTGRYRTVLGGNVPRGYTISRADVAHYLLVALADPATVGQPVGIAY